MSTAFTQFLTNFAGGVFSDVGYLRDYQHAARLYQSNNYELAPKATWSYFVEFGFHPSLLNKAYFPSIDESWYNRSKDRIGLLAKTVDQPRVTVGTETYNQYNRKTVVMSKLAYTPVGITFHDDMANVVANLWKNYYQYYFADSRYDGFIRDSRQGGRSFPEAYEDVKYNNRAYAYGLNNGQIFPNFFKNLTIYLLNRKEYVSITLVNPKITEWAPSTLDQTSNNRLLDIKMTLAYEAVYYDYSGRKITADNPGFNKNYYDKTTSPLTIAGKGSRSLFGPGGLIAGATDIFETLSQENLSVGDIIKLGVQGKNLITNAKALTKSGIKQESYSIVNSVFAKAATGQNQVGNVINTALKQTAIQLPKHNNSIDATIASQRGDI